MQIVLSVLQDFHFKSPVTPQDLVKLVQHVLQVQVAQLASLQTLLNAQVVSTACILTELSVQAVPKVVPTALVSINVFNVLQDLLLPKVDPFKQVNLQVS